MNQKNPRFAVIALILAAGLLAGVGLNPEEEFSLLLKWKKPENYPPPILEGMKIETLSLLLDSGNLQWYQPRPQPERWEAVVGMKIHAPAEKVWEVITDYPALCKIMPLTYLHCATEWRKGNQVKNNQKGQTTVIQFAYHYDIIDLVTEDPPAHLHVNTIEGLKDRELDMILIPVENNTATLFFMRYYLDMSVLGWSMQAVLKVMPTVEPPTAVGAANYHTRAYKNEAEHRVGYQARRSPPPLQFSQLDLETLRRIAAQGGGMIRETPEGEMLEVLAYTFIAAPPTRVWEVMTDFEHYEEIFPGSTCQLESREGNQVTLLQKTSSVSVLIFSFGYELHSRYTLAPPDHLSYLAIDGTYRGSHGDLRILPLEGGKQTLLFGTASVNLQHDTGLTARIARSGAFPLENMINLLGIQSNLARLRQAAEKK